MIVLKNKIGERIKESISDFTGVNNSFQIDKYEYYPDSISLNRLSEEGIETKDLDGIIHTAEACLDSLNYTVNHQIFNHHCSVVKLGKKKDKKNSPQNKEDVSKTALQMARILASYREEIVLSVISQDNYMGQVNTNFVISSISEVDPLVSMIRSVYGNVEIHKLSRNQVPVFSSQYYAQGKFLFKSKETSKREKEYRRYESWISSVLNSLPEDGNYKASIRFVPSDTEESVKEKIKQLSDIYNELSFYSEISWGNTGNVGASMNHQGNIAESTRDSFLGNKKLSDNISFSMNLSSKEVNKYAQRLKEEIEFAIMRLKIAETTSSWGVQISISADNVDTIQTISSVISGTLSEQGLNLYWGTDNSKAFIANAEEILPMLRFPDKEFAGFEFVENDEFSLVSPSGNENGFETGKILWNSVPFAPFYLSKEAFSRHAFVCGMTGSGKSNTIFNIIEGINLPCVVIEPVKGEYRALRAVFPDMKVWTMKAGDTYDSSVSVLRINPFWFPVDSNLAFHIDSLKTIISSAFELSAAMPNILEQCLYNVYINAGWDLITNKNIYANQLPEEYLFPTFSDLCNEIEDYLDKSDFGEEVLGNYKGALLSRMKSFVNGYKGILLNTTAFPNYSDFLNGHCVIELEGLADDADKCLVMGTILVQYYQYLKQNFKDSEDKKKLNHLIVIEEAHRLFKKSKKNKTAESGSDPTGQLVDSLSNMMAEIRAFGEGMLIVDQSPTKLADDVVKNSATKIIHRIDNGDDIKVLQSSMLLPDDTTSFAMLKQGEALVRTDRMTKPCKVLMNCNDDKETYSLSDSFTVFSSDNSELREIFVATSILYNKEIANEIQEYTMLYINSLALTNFELWYEITEDLLYEVILILKHYKVYDMVDFRLTILFKIILLSIKKDLNYKSKKDMGLFHMFISRLFDFYQEKRSGAFIKKGVLELFKEFFEKNIRETLIGMNLDNVSFSLTKKMKNFEQDELFISLVLHYFNTLLPMITPEMDFKNIENCFYEYEFLTSAQGYIRTAYSNEFADIYQQIDLLKIRKENSHE